MDAVLVDEVCFDLGPEYNVHNLAWQEDDLEENVSSIAPRLQHPKIELVLDIVLGPGVLWR